MKFVNNIEKSFIKVDLTNMKIFCLYDVNGTSIKLATNIFLVDLSKMLPEVVS